MNSKTPSDADDSPKPAVLGAKRLTLEMFGDLAIECYPALWTLARSAVRSAEDAEDVVQEAMLIGLNKRDGFELGTSFLAWMGTIVRLTAKNYGRYQSRRTHAALDPAMQDPAVRPAPPAEVEPTTGRVNESQGAFDDDVSRALARLTPVARGCLMLRTQHEMDYETIGQIMGVPKNTAMSHVHRSRQALRNHLSQHLERVTTGRRAGT
ncbi:MAG: RNA polymerase sigma factor [Planctomycetota bacterium]